MILSPARHPGGRRDGSKVPAARDHQIGSGDVVGIGGEQITDGGEDF